MRNFQLASISLFLLFSDLSCISGRVLPPAERLKPEKTIPALFHKRLFRSTSVFSPRSCDPGEHRCNDDGCCPSNQYCDTLDGVVGCCDLGKVCHLSSHDPRCGKEGYTLCSDRPFCCPTGDTCEHDNDTGAFACLNPKNGNFDSPVSAVLTSIKLPPTLTATLTATEETSTPTITTTLTAVDSATKTLTAVDSATKTLPPTIAETLTAGDSDTKTLPPTTTNTFFDSILNPELLTSAITTSTISTSSPPPFAATNEAAASVAVRSSTASSSSVTASLVLVGLVVILFL